jgi:hypothetical protein
MSGTHFKGPVQFSNQTPALQNLNIGNWPDQVYYMDDFLDHVLNIGGAAGNFWSLINSTNCPTTLATLGNDGSLNGEASSVLAGAQNDGTLIQSNMNYSTPNTAGNRLYFECRTKLTTVAGGVFQGGPNTFWGMAEEGATRGSTFGAAVTSLIGFKSLAGALQLTVCVKAPNGAEIQLTPTDANLVALGTMAANTFVTLGFELTNNPAVVSNNNTKTSSVNFYINRQLYATCRTLSRTGGTPSSQFTAGTQSGTAVTYDALPAAGIAAQRMGMTWDIIATIAAANTLTSDYFMASQDRGVVYNPND